MKPFRFPLQPLRELREQTERAAHLCYAETFRACESAAAAVQAASEALTASWTALGADLAAGVSGTNLLRTRAWCNVLELRLKERTSALEVARHAVDAVWKEMIAARLKGETLDRHPDKERRTHDREVQQAEQKTVDDLAVHLLRAPVSMGGAAGSRRSQ